MRHPNNFRELAPTETPAGDGYRAAMINSKHYRTPPTADRGALIEDFRSFVAHPAFPCVGAKSALNRDRIEFEVCDRLGSRASAEVLRDGLARFSARFPNPGLEPVSFVSIFREPVAGEDDFHKRLWLQLQAIHDLDIEEHAWAPDVSDDPGSADFSFSVASRAFFVVGLHPRSSRLARRAPRPTLVFNFHGQFEALRTNGRFEKLQGAIRKRDVALQGDINPVLARYGEASEALQYSGRVTGACPFRARSESARTPRL
jgi:FPC/CPF motif-containing protein YcgG